MLHRSRLISFLYPVHKTIDVCCQLCSTTTDGGSKQCAHDATIHGAQQASLTHRSAIHTSTLIRAYPSQSRQTWIPHPRGSGPHTGRQRHKQPRNIALTMPVVKQHSPHDGLRLFQINAPPYRTSTFTTSTSRTKRGNQ